MFNTYLEVDKEIVSEIYTSSDPLDNLKILCDVYGSRAPGTQGDFGSVKWMVEKLKSYGIENAHYETYKLQSCIRGPAQLEVTQPIRAREIKKNFDCISLPNGLPGEVEGKLVYLGDGHLNIYEERKDQIEGNIVMVTSHNPSGMTRTQPLHRIEKYMRSILAGAKGWIFMSQYPAYGPQTGSVRPIIPAISVSYENGKFLLRLLEQEGDLHVKITTTDVIKEMISYNVVCDIPGTSNEEEYVLVGSHYDGHDISQGAVDPASGTVTIMEIARVLNMVKNKLKRRIRFVCFGAEEESLIGSYNYVAQHESEMDKLRFMLNLDAIGGSPGKKGVIIHGYPELNSFMNRVATEIKTELPYAQRWGGSDQWPFFLKGVPTASGGDPEAKRVRTGRGYGHTYYDTVDKVDIDNIHRAASNYARLLLRVANTDDWPGKRKTRKEIKKFLETQGHDGIIFDNKVRDHLRTWKEIHPITQAWLDKWSINQWPTWSPDQ